MSEKKIATMALSDLTAVYEALNRVQAIIEFELDGTVISANENFLRNLGYDLDEIVGKHHRMFCDPSYAESPEYAEFWKSLSRGECEAAEFKRLAKGGEQIWFRASYNPVFGEDGKPIKVVKFATNPALFVGWIRLICSAGRSPGARCFSANLPITEPHCALEDNVTSP